MPRYTHGGTALQALALCTVCILLPGVGGEPASLDKDCPEGCRDMDKITSCGSTDFVSSCVVHLNGTVTMRCSDPCMQYTLSAAGCSTQAECSDAMQAWGHLYLFADNLARWYTSLDGAARTATNLIMGACGAFLLAFAPLNLLLTFALGGILAGVPIGLAISRTADLCDEQGNPGPGVVVLALIISAFFSVVLMSSYRMSVGLLPGIAAAFLSASVIAHSAHASTDLLAPRDIALALVPPICFAAGVALGTREALRVALFAASTSLCGAALLTQSVVSFAWDIPLFECGTPAQCSVTYILFTLLWAAGFAFQYAAMHRLGFHWDPMFPSRSGVAERVKEGFGPGQLQGGPADTTEATNLLTHRGLGGGAGEGVSYGGYGGVASGGNLQEAVDVSAFDSPSNLPSRGPGAFVEVY